MKASTRKQLNVRSNEAYERAHRLAKRLGTTTQDVVVMALRALESDRGICAPQSEEQAVNHVKHILDEARRELWGGKEPPPLDHKAMDDWLYDENGLPH
ncbi:MAG: type II toxin-antitoxin system VapB family antitoxin [Bosea sp. (in: a-proteobacteria)]